MNARDEDAPTNWRAWNVNLGLLLAFIMGIATVVAASFGIQLWLDDRIDDRIDARLAPLKKDIEQLQGEVRAAQTRQQQQFQTIVQILRDLERSY